MSAKEKTQGTSPTDQTAQTPATNGSDTSIILIISARYGWNSNLHVCSFNPLVYFKAYMKSSYGYCSWQMTSSLQRTPYASIMVLINLNFQNYKKRLHTFHATKGHPTPHSHVFSLSATQKTTAEFLICTPTHPDISIHLQLPLESSYILAAWQGLN